MTAVGSAIADGDAAGATGAFVGATGGVLETYTPGIGENLQNSEALATNVVKAGQDGDVGAVITTSADLAAQQVDNEKTSTLIHGLGEDTAKGVAVGGAEGMLVALNGAAVTSNQVLNDGATIPDSSKHYTDANGIELSEDQIDAILATAGITEAPENNAEALVPDLTLTPVSSEPMAQQVVVEPVPQPEAPIVIIPATQD